MAKSYKVATKSLGGPKDRLIIQQHGDKSVSMFFYEGTKYKQGVVLRPEVIDRLIRVLASVRTGAI